MQFTWPQHQALCTDGCEDYTIIRQLRGCNKMWKIIRLENIILHLIWISRPFSFMVISHGTFGFQILPKP